MKNSRHNPDLPGIRCKGTVGLVLIWSALLSLPVFYCGSPEEFHGFPSFSPGATSADTGFFYGAGLPQIPPSFFGAQDRKIQISSDSMVYFYSRMASRQGVSIAFQEWLACADQSSGKIEGLRGIGKKAVLFRTNAGWTWIIFYSGKFVYGVGGRDRDQTLGAAGHWFREMSG